MASPSRSQVAGDRRLLWALGGALLIATIVFIALSGSGRTTEEPPGAGAAEESEEMPDLSRRIDGDPTALGSVDAPVVLIEFADYRCPFCGVFGREVLPAIVDDYVEEGLVRVEWRDVPVFGEESFWAAVAGRAAGAQGLFWEYNEAVYAYPERDKQPLPRARLIEIAREVGMPDMAAFEAGLDDPELIALVEKDAQEASALGVRSTPTFLVGRVPLMGAQPEEVFRNAIESELERVGR